MSNKLTAHIKYYQNKIRWTCVHAVLAKDGWRCFANKGGVHYCRLCDIYVHK